jgi:hypothetical protein
VDSGSRNNPRGRRLTKYGAPLRPTRHRLIIAMGVAACFVSLVLASVGFFAKFAAGTLDPAFRSPGLTVHIKHDEDESELQFESVNQIRSLELPEDPSVAETATVPEDVSSVTPPALQFDEQPVVDWQNMIAETVTSIGKERQEREEIRALMWRKTHSIMFQSAGSFVPKQQEPIIPDFQFKPQVHVGGLGVTIGSCFIGLPIVGVPVEERTVAIGLFVCAKDSG